MGVPQQADRRSLSRAWDRERVLPTLQIANRQTTLLPPPRSRLCQAADGGFSSTAARMNFEVQRSHGDGSYTGAPGRTHQPAATAAAPAAAQLSRLLPSCPVAAAEGLDQFPDTQRFLDLLSALNGPPPANGSEQERPDMAAARGLFRRQVGAILHPC